MGITKAGSLQLENGPLEGVGDLDCGQIFRPTGTQQWHQSTPVWSFQHFIYIDKPKPGKGWQSGLFGSLPQEESQIRLLCRTCRYLRS